MLDLSHIPNSQQDIQIFHANGSAWQTWQKPRKCNYVYIICIGGGGGGGGGGGLSFDSVGAIGGGGGGVSRALYNASILPDRLYIQVGLGGAGGIGATVSGGNGTSGSSGTRSWVSLQQQTGAIVAQNIVQGSGTTAAAGGTCNPSGATAAGEVAMAQTSGTFLILSNFIATAGQTSPNPAVNGNVTPLTSQITSAGAPFGGGISATSLSPEIPSAFNGITAGNGGNGITSWKPFFSTGGAGGGALAGVNGGNGGNGGIGSGGGGGGSANASGSIVAGNGGKGGDGLVMIISF